MEPFSTQPRLVPYRKWWESLGYRTIRTPAMGDRWCLVPCWAYAVAAERIPKVLIDPSAWASQGIPVSMEGHEWPMPNFVDADTARMLRLMNERHADAALAIFSIRGRRGVVEFAESTLAAEAATS